MKTLRAGISFILMALIATMLHAAPQTGPKLVVDLKGHAKNIKGLAFSSNGKQLCSVAEDNEIKIWDVAARKSIATIHVDDLRSHHVPFSPDGKTLATARKDGSIKLLEAHTGKLVLNLIGHTEPVVAVAFSADGKILASASSIYGRNKSKDYEGDVRLWDIATAKPITIVKGDQDPLEVAFSRDSKTLASTWRGGTIRLLDVGTGQVSTRKRKDYSIRTMAFNPNGSLIATVQTVSATAAPKGGFGGPGGGGPPTESEIWVWETLTGKNTDSFVLPGNVFSMAFHPGGINVVTGDYTGMIRFSDIDTGRGTASFQGQLGCIDCLAISPDGKTMASGGRDTATVKLWDISGYIPR